MFDFELKPVNDGAQFIWGWNGFDPEEKKVVKLKVQGTIDKYGNVGIGNSCLYDIILMGMELMKRDGLLKTKGARASTRQLIEVFKHNNMCKNYRQHRLYSRKKLVPDMLKNNSIKVKKGEEPFLERLVEGILSAKDENSSEFTPEEIFLFIFHALFRPTNGDSNIMPIDDERLGDFHHDFSRWFHGVNKTNVSRNIYSEARSKRQISHSFEDINNNDKKTNQDSFFSLLYHSMNAAAPLYTRSAKELEKNIQEKIKNTSIPFNIDYFKNLYTSQEWFGNLPVAMIAMMRPSEDKRVEKYGKKYKHTGVPPFIEMLFYAVCFGKKIDPIVTVKIASSYRILSDSFIENRPSSYQKKCSEYSDQINYGSEDKEDNTPLSEHLSEFVDNEFDSILSSAVIQHSSETKTEGVRVKWKKVLKELPSELDAEKVRDYWRKTLKPKIAAKAKSSMLNSKPPDSR